MTIACWVKVNKFKEAYQTIVSKGDSAWRLTRHNNSDQVEFASTAVANDKSKFAHIKGQTSINDGLWHHVAWGCRLAPGKDPATCIDHDALVGTRVWSWRLFRGTCVFGEPR